MKKFLVRMFFFFVAVTIIDLIFGKCCDYMYEHSGSGDSVRQPNTRKPLDHPCPE